jgi:hypothetical protein
MADAPIMLSAAEVAIIRRLREAELIHAMTWFDEHAGSVHYRDSDIR